MGTDLNNRFQKLKSRIDFLENDFDKKESEINTGLKLIDDLNKGRWVLTEVQKSTQLKFKSKVETLVTMAIKSVYDRPFGFELMFERKREKIECQPFIYEIVNGEKEYYDDPENELGGGIIDIVSFALRIVLWTLEKPRSRNVFVFDEPGKNLGALIITFGKMLQEVAHSMNIQIIVISHDEELIEVADKSWHVDHDGRKSIVTISKG